MDRQTHARTHGDPRGGELAGSGRWNDTHGREPRPTESSEPPSRPLLDRLTQAGGGRWVPLSGSGGIREG